MPQPKNNHVYSVKELLQFDDVVIPEYQRPYKWNAKHINELFQDLHEHRHKSAYRLGAVVYHQQALKDKNKQQFNIVDGQQRTLTLLLAVLAITRMRLRGDDESEVLTSKVLVGELRDLDAKITTFIERQTFASQISQHNLLQNYRQLERLVSHRDFTEAHIEFLLNQCQLVVFVLNDVSEAFQFFDSQNARGRDLEPHDLLKAFHLREFAEHEADLKATTVAYWERMPSDKLAKLFAIYLYRIRHWAQGKSARFFDKNQVGLFKGVNLDKPGRYPYMESMRITHHFVDEYNRQYQRHIDGQRMMFPFHLDQIVINGRRFFEMAQHYQQVVSNVVGASASAPNEWLFLNNASLSETAFKIFKLLNTYANRNRTGDQYVRSLFDCALIFYIDKFGSQEISRAIERLFIWAYSCRIKQHAVQVATVDNYALAENYFRYIKEAITPEDVLTRPLKPIKASDNKNNRDEFLANEDELVNQFRDMRFYE